MLIVLYRDKFCHLNEKIVTDKTDSECQMWFLSKW
jgi:hypothetical protein